MATVTLTDKVKFYESVFGSGRMARNCKNFDVRCPICAPRDPNKKKLAIHTEDDRVHCWVCGYKARTLAPLIRKYGTRASLIEYRDRFMPESEYKRRCLDTAFVEEKISLPKDFKLFATAGVRDPDVLAMRKYLNARNVSDRDLWFYKLGFSEAPEWRRRIIVPSFDAAGELNWYIGRTIDKFKRPKYEAPTGDRKHIIFNEINVDWTQRLVLCEGTFDMMKCGDNAVPLLGSDLNEESALFNSILVHSTPIALALDADMRITKTPLIAKKLANYDIDVIIVNVPSDPGEMTKQEFKAALLDAQPLDWQQAFFDRLEHASKLSL